LENNFDEIIFMFDNDEPGIAAAQECAALLTPGRARVAQLPAKDPSELLMEGKGSEIINAMWRAPVYRPDGVVNGKDVANEICKAYKPADSLYPWQGLNEITRGLRKGEIATICAGTGIGKSQIMRELAHHIIKTNPESILGYIALEESIKRTAFGLMSIEANRLLHLDPDLKEEELRDLHEKVFGGGRVYLYDHWGGLDGESLLAKIRYLVNGCGVEWIVLDHLSIMVSGQEGGDERKTIDKLMTNLRKLVEELNFGLLLVSHLKRPEGKAHEDGASTSLGQLRGSASIGQLSDIVIGVERNQQDEARKHVSTLRVLKNRFSGDTGVACELVYNTDTGRMTEDDPMSLNNTDEEEIEF
jgi:twinkle protein